MVESNSNSNPSLVNQLDDWQHLPENHMKQKNLKVCDSHNNVLHEKFHFNNSLSVMNSPTKV